MESNIECISSADGMDEDEIPHPNPFSQFSSSKPSHNNSNNSINTNSLNGVVINPATSVHELLECPVCTNSMYPPIHQVCFLDFFFFILFYCYLFHWLLLIALKIQDYLGNFWFWRNWFQDFMLLIVFFFLKYSALNLNEYLPYLEFVWGNNSKRFSFTQVYMGLPYFVWFVLFLEHLNPGRVNC